ncbi:MAG: ABC transporter ATP-binding protein [Chloroflexi bacterium]|nr:ABC transporter ATP-binding protein [Chloroflexota bacterium]
MMYGGPPPGHWHGGGGGGGGFGFGRHLSSALDDDMDEVLGKAYDSRVMKRLSKYFAPVRFRLTISLIGMVIMSLASLAPPYLIAKGTDQFMKNGDLTGLTIVALLVVLSQLLVWGGGYIETLFMAYAGQSILYKLRTDLFDHLQKLSLSFYDRHEVGKLMSRVQNDVQQLEEIITQGIVSLLSNGLTLIGIAVFMIIMNPPLAMLTLTAVPVLGISLFIWQNYARHSFIRVRRAIAVVNGQLQESISGVRVIQSLSRENVNARRFDSVNRAHLNANVEAGRLTSVIMPLVEILTAVATGLVIVFGGSQILAGTMGVGVLVAFLLYIQRFFEPIREVTMQYSELQRAMASGVRIFELLDVEPDIKDKPGAIKMPPAKGEIKFNNISFSYKPGVEVLHDINLTIQPGEMVAVVGKTGAGKSSLASLIARFYEASAGEVCIDGYDVTSVTQQSLRRNIGIVPQDPILFSGTVADNIRYGVPDASEEDVIRAAKMVGAHEFISRLGQGYDTPVGERGGSLSAGQRQFICLARAVLNDPPILILDEATSNIDTNAERLIQESLHHLSKGRTCLLIAHRLSTVTGADRIIVMELGRIVESGSHLELMAKRGVYYNMVTAQTMPQQVG